MVAAELGVKRGQGICQLLLASNKTEGMRGLLKIVEIFMVQVIIMNK